MTATPTEAVEDMQAEIAWLKASIAKLEAWGPDHAARNEAELAAGHVAGSAHDRG